MARLQYQPATKPRGFQPIQLSRAGIARMEEESNRVIRNLEKQRDATNQQRRENLQAMRENSAYEMRARERNQNIVEANLKSEQLSIQAEQKTKQQQADANAKAIESTLTSLVDFSVTLGKQAAERTKRMIEDQTAEGAIEAEKEYYSNPQQQADYETAASQLPVASAQYDYTIATAAAKGELSSLETAKSYAANPARSFYAQQGYDNKMLVLQTSDMMDKELKDATPKYVDERTGKKFSGFEANTDRDLMRQLLGSVSTRLRGSDGLNLNSRPAGYLKSSSDVISKLHQSYLNSAERSQTKFINQNLALDAQSLRDQGNYVEAFRMDSLNPMFGTKGALDNLFNHALIIDPRTGDFLISLDDFNNIRPTADQTIYDRYKNSPRYLKLLENRNKRKTDFLRDDQARVRVEAKEFVRQSYAAMEARFGRGTYQEDLNAIATFNKEFRERYSGGEPMPERMVLLQKSILAGNKKDEELILAKHIELKSLDQAAVEKFLNPTVKGQAIVAYKELQENKFGPNYAESKKAYSTKSTDLIKRDPNVGSIQGFLVFNAMVNEHKYAYQKSIDAGVPPKVAEQEARQYVDTLVNKGINDPNSDFFRDTGPLNSLVFPKLEARYAELSRTAKEARYELLKGLLKKGVSIVDEPGALGTEEELVSSTNDYYNNNGQFRYNPSELLVHKTFGIPLYAIRNAGLSALNKADGGNRRLIEPTQLEKEVFDQDPETLKLITDTDKITFKRAERAIRSGSSSIGNGPMRRTFDTSRKERALIDTIRDVEGTSGPQGYNTVYGGAVVPQLTQMTLGELYDAIKLGGTDAIPERLGGGKIPFKKDKYNSSASGALQLMPETLRGLVNSGNYTWDTVFSPETQDKMFIQLSREAGVDINNPDFNKVGKVWAGASPALGQTTRTASDTMSIYNQKLNQN